MTKEEFVKKLGNSIKGSPRKMRITTEEGSKDSKLSLEVKRGKETSCVSIKCSSMDFEKQIENEELAEDLILRLSQGFKT